jgi:hypothetical protein
VEVDCVDEVLFVPECSSGIFHPLDLGVERFTGGIGNRGEGVLMLIQVGYASNADADGAGTLRLTALPTPEWSNRTRSCREAG